MSASEESVLARYRVGEGTYRSMPMTEDQIIRRRKFMRMMLKTNSRFNRCTDEQLDNMRLFHIDDQYYVEGENMVEYPF